jgi:predicted ArsR family transcriptional regulator
VSRRRAKSERNSQPPSWETSGAWFLNPIGHVITKRNVLDEIPATRAAIFRLLKQERFASIPRIAEALGVSHEAARKQVGDLQRNGWIDSDCGPEEAQQRESTPGRPPVRYCLTAAGDHFFPKQYPQLLVSVLDTIAAEGGNDAFTSVLARITDDRVARLEPRVATRPMKRRIEELRAIYREGDPFTDVQRRGENYVLVERNCPYLSVAMERPDICSTTVSTLRRLTGCEVVRERRFQDGDGRCEFHVKTAQSSPERQQLRFEKEPPRTS